MTPWISSLSTLEGTTQFCLVPMFISALCYLSFECLVRKWNRTFEKNSFLFFFLSSIHFKWFTLSLIVQLTSINRAEFSETKNLVNSIEIHEFLLFRMMQFFLFFFSFLFLKTRKIGNQMLRATRISNRAGEKGGKFKRVFFFLFF